MGEMIDALRDEVMREVIFRARNGTDERTPSDIAAELEIVLTPEQEVGLKLDAEAFAVFATASPKPATPTFMGIPIEVVLGYAGPLLRPRGFVKHTTYS